MQRAMLLATLLAAAAAAFAQPPQEAKTVLKRPETADPAVRCVLEGIPWIGFYGGNNRGPEDDPFPACVRAFLEYRGENLGIKPRQKHDPWHVVHVYIKGVCGASFRLGWDGKDWGWGGNDLTGEGLPDDFVLDYVRAWQRADWAAGGP